MRDFDGRMILVTGAAGSIGGETVRRLVEAGAQVVASDRPSDALEQIARETGSISLPFDLESETEIQRAITGLDLYGLVNCAGVGLVDSVIDCDADVFDRVLRINARGTLLTTKYASQEMIRQSRGGSIVNVSSQASLVALQGHVSYGASKAAVDSITRVSALELGRYGIRVNTVNPTVVMSVMSAGYWGQPEIEGPFLKAMPLGRWATEPEIAGPIVFLLSDDAAMITGATLPVDGGFSCQ